MSAKILFLEHDEDDVYITESYFREMDLQVELKVLRTPEAMLNELNYTLSKGNKLPDILMMDYNAVGEHPGKFISKIKSHGHFGKIPVIVLRGVAEPEVIRECYQHGANSFIRKPAGSEDIKRKISQMIDYWFDCVSLPK